MKDLARRASRSAGLRSEIVKMAQASSPILLFVYGTLMAEEIVSSLLGLTPPHRAASVHGFARSVRYALSFTGMILPPCCWLDGLPL